MRQQEKPFPVTKDAAMISYVSKEIKVLILSIHVYLVFVLSCTSLETVKLSQCGRCSFICCRLVCLGLVFTRHNKPSVLKDSVHRD